MMPHKVGVGVKFAAELLAMDLRMTLHRHAAFIIISIDITNAYNVITRDAVLGAHNKYAYMRRTVPFWRAKPGPTTK